MSGDLEKLIKRRNKKEDEKLIEVFRSDFRLIPWPITKNKLGWFIAFSKPLFEGRQALIFMRLLFEETKNFIEKCKKSYPLEFHRFTEDVGVDDTPFFFGIFHLLLLELGKSYRSRYNKFLKDLCKLKEEDDET